MTGGGCNVRQSTRLRDSGNPPLHGFGSWRAVVAIPQNLLTGGSFNIVGQIADSSGGASVLNATVVNYTVPTSKGTFSNRLCVPLTWAGYAMTGISATMDVTVYPYRYVILFAASGYNARARLCGGGRGDTGVACAGVLRFCK